MRVIATAYAFLAAIFIMSIGGSPAQAAETSLTNPDLVLQALTAANVSEILTELGAQEVAARDIENGKVVDFKSAGDQFHAALLGCSAKPEGCFAMVMLVAFDEGQTTHPLEAYNAFNRENPFASVNKLEGGKYAVTRMVVAEGGLTKKNIAVNFSGFAGAPQAIAKHWASQIIAGVQQNGGQLQPASLSTASERSVTLSPGEIKSIVDRLRLPKPVSMKAH